MCHLKTPLYCHPRVSRVTFRRLAEITGRAPLPVPGNPVPMAQTHPLGRLQSMSTISDPDHPLSPLGLSLREKKGTSMNISIPVLSITAILALSGCATPSDPAPEPSLVTDSLAESVSQIAAVTAGLRTSAQPYDGFPLPTDGRATGCRTQVASPLHGQVTVQWSGPVSVLLNDMAARLGWSYQSELGIPEPMVAIDMTDVRIIDVLARAAAQMPPNTRVDVMPGVIMAGVVGDQRP